MRSIDKELKEAFLESLINSLLKILQQRGVKRIKQRKMTNKMKKIKIENQAKRNKTMMKAENQRRRTQNKKS